MSAAKKCWRCDKCGSTHGYYDDASECCPSMITEVFVCAECEEEHSTKELGDACCAEPVEMTPAQVALELEARGQMRLIE